MNDQDSTLLARGAALIRTFAQALPETPGVYRMLDQAGAPLYVGKAKALKRRVMSYTKTEKLPIRLQRMVAATFDMAFVHTHTEVEALLLESNLIKKLKPRYNVLLRDDKSFPYIMITENHDFPLLTKHRGARDGKASYFGPFASALAVNQTIMTLQRAFLLRNCSDNYFAQRKRPCLQYHIKRCTAPCVGFVSKDDYAAQVQQARDFLSGKSRKIQDVFARAMQNASNRMDYEAAAQYRDRIKALTSVQTTQDINVAGLGDVDVIGLWQENGRTAIEVFVFRAGQNFGNRCYFPRHAEDEATDIILGAFLVQFYESKPVPQEIILSHQPADAALIAQALGERAGRKVSIIVPRQGQKKRLVDQVAVNARDSLRREVMQLDKGMQLMQLVAERFGLEAAPKLIEVYDNSHVSGTNMVGAMIVAGPEGFRKNAYRKFNIRKAQAADDYGMMREVMQRRFGKITQTEARTEDWPDLLLIDGGLGQFNAVMEVLQDMGIAERLAVVSIAKGPDRNAGREKFFMSGQPSFMLPPDDTVLHYLQRLRDEAHRFAIGAHRTRRAKSIGASPLDDIPGIGARRKKALLLHFGSARDVAAAGVRDLQQVEGVSASLAQRIYDFFHDNSQT